MRDLLEQALLVPLALLREQRRVWPDLYSLKYEKAGSEMAQLFY